MDQTTHKLGRLALSLALIAVALLPEPALAEGASNRAGDSPPPRQQALTIALTATASGAFLGLIGLSAAEDFMAGAQYPDLAYSVLPVAGVGLGAAAGAGLSGYKVGLGSTSGAMALGAGIGAGLGMSASMAIITQTDLWMGTFTDPLILARSTLIMTLPALTLGLGGTYLGQKMGSKMKSMEALRVTPLLMPAEKGRLAGLSLHGHF